MVQRADDVARRTGRFGSARARARASSGRGQRARERLWREWCFARAAFVHRGWALALLALLLAGGAWLFERYEPDPRRSFVESMYRTWMLVLAQPPGQFPAAPELRFLCFLVPILGLTVIVEAIVETGLLLRDRRRNESNWCRIMADSMRDHVVLVGLGKLGIRVYHLLRRLGCAVVVLEKDGASQFLDDVRRDGSPVFVGDARREAFLHDAGIARARSIVLATDDDLANLEIALDARRLNAGIRVVLRMFDPNTAQKVRDGFQIRAVLSSSELSAPAFALSALEGGIVASTVLDDVLVMTQRRTVAAGDATAGRTVAELLRERGVQVVQRRAAGGSVRLFPPPEERVEAGDEIVVQGRFEALEELGAAQLAAGREATPL